MVVAAWIFSVVMTIAILMVSGAGRDANSASPEKARAMREIEEEYFGDAPHGPIAARTSVCCARPGRPAPVATSRPSGNTISRFSICCGRNRGTRIRVSAHASSHGLEKGITGSRDHDRELEKLIITVLGD